MPLLRPERSTGYLLARATLLAVYPRVTRALPFGERRALSYRCMDAEAATARGGEMTTEALQSAATNKPRVVCKLDASTKADELLGDALSLCEEQDAQLVVVWVLEPRLFSSPFPGSAGAVGTFGLPGVLHAAIERARERGITATSMVRIGDREVVLRREAEAVAAIAVFDANGEKSGPARTPESDIVLPTRASTAATAARGRPNGLESARDERVDCDGRVGGLCPPVASRRRAPVLGLLRMHGDPHAALTGRDAVGVWADRDRGDDAIRGRVDA
jgi:hypothetical protein